MSKHLLSSLLAVSILLVFLSTVAWLAYWEITRAPWWQCDLAALVVFVQGMAMGLWGMANEGRISRAQFALWLRDTLNSVILHRIGLHCATMSYFELLSQDHVALVERQAYDSSLIELRELAISIGYQVEVIAGEDAFTVYAGDESVSFINDYEGVLDALAALRCEVEVRAESEAH